MQEGTGGQRQQKHLLIVDSIKKLDITIGRADVLRARINGEESMKSISEPSLTKALPPPMSLTEFLNETPDTLMKMNEALCKLIADIECMLF